MIFGSGLALGAALLTAAPLLCALLACLWWFDRCDHEPVRALAVAGAWGVAAAVATDFGLRRWPGGGERVLVDGHSFGAAVGLLVLAIAGQSLLAVGVALLARRLDGPTDGMLVGVVAGLGWAIWEAARSTPGPVAAGGEAASPALSTVLMVVVAGVGARAVATGTFGGLVGMARIARTLGARVLWPAGGLAVAILVDAGWRWGREAVVESGSGWSGALLLLGLVIAVGALLPGLLLSAEGRVLAEELEEELAWRVVPAWVVTTIPSYRVRVRGEWWPDRRTRVVVARLLSRLALRKRAVRGLPPAAAGLAALEVGKLRSRTRALLLPEGTAEE